MKFSKLILPQYVLQFSKEFSKAVRIVHYKLVAIAIMLGTLQSWLLGGKLKISLGIPSGKLFPS